MAPPEPPHRGALNMLVERLDVLGEYVAINPHLPAVDLFTAIRDKTKWLPENQLFASYTPGPVLDCCLSIYRFEPRLQKLVQSLPPSQKNAFLHCLRQSPFHDDFVRRNELVDCFGCHQRPQKHDEFRYCTSGCQFRQGIYHTFASTMITKTIIWLDNLPYSGIDLRKDPVTFRAFPLHRIYGQLDKMTHTQCAVVLGLIEPLVYSRFIKLNFFERTSPSDCILLNGIPMKFGLVDCAGFELTLGLPTEESRERPVPDGLDLWQPTVQRIARLCSSAFEQMNPWREAVPVYKERLRAMKENLPFKVDGISIMLGYLSSLDSDGVTLDLLRNYKYAVVVSLLTRDVDHVLEAFADRHERGLDTFTREYELLRRNMEMWELQLRHFARMAVVGGDALEYSKAKIALCRPKWRKLRE